MKKKTLLQTDLERRQFVLRFEKKRDDICLKFNHHIGSKITKKICIIFYQSSCWPLI